MADLEKESAAAASENVEKESVEKKPAEREPAGKEPAETDSPGHRKKPFLRLAGEALWILLAVLLALGADQWRESQANKKLAKRALDGIVQEIERNRNVLGYFLPRHEKLLGEMPQSSEGWTPPALTNETERFDPVFLRDTAWRTALETQAMVHMDYQIVLDLTEVYTFQQAYAELNRDLIRSSFDLDLHDPGRLEAQFRMTQYFLYIFVANERKLLETYDEALGRLKESKTAANQKSSRGES